MRRILLWLSLFFLLGLSCSKEHTYYTEPKPNDEGTYSGVFHQGIENSYWFPCGTDENWRIVFADATLEQAWFDRAQPVLLEDYKAFMTLKGIPTAKGEYCNIFDCFDREFTVTNVVEVRRVRSSDCN